MERTRKILRSFTTRMVASHILVAAVTAIIVAAAQATLIWKSVDDARAGEPNTYGYISSLYAKDWLIGHPSGRQNQELADPADGFTLVVSENDRVLWTQGATDCKDYLRLETCAPDLFAMGERKNVVDRFEKDGETWTNSVFETITGHRIYMQRGPLDLSPSLIINKDIQIHGYEEFIAYGIFSIAVPAIPIALIIASLLVRPQLRRLSTIADVSRRFSNGELQVRVNDRRQDEVGNLAQQFNDMADGLEQNIYTLRDLVQRNADLAQQAEEAAIQAERVRLSRDLHDAIAQRLFSLSVSASTLPNMIQKDQQKGVIQASAIAELAETTLLDLRSLLLELRPSSLLQRGLPEALRSLCDESTVEAECSLILTGHYIPAPIEDILYRIAQEALNNANKHAEASSVSVSVVEGKRQLTMSISDDGKGFDPAVRGNGKFGLMSMRERANSVGGELTIETNPTRGTTVQIVLPIERKLQG